MIETKTTLRAEVEALKKENSALWKTRNLQLRYEKKIYRLLTGREYDGKQVGMVQLFCEADYLRERGHLDWASVDDKLPKTFNDRHVLVRDGMCYWVCFYMETPECSVCSSNNRDGEVSLCTCGMKSFSQWWSPNAEMYIPLVRHWTYIPSPLSAAGLFPDC